ncbi:MAG: alpha-L-fucosidase [Bacteroidota bacterium]|nr:alpha-L-fucosidase [Bacteroidota bacterium]
MKTNYKKLISVAISLLLLVNVLLAQTETPQQKSARMKWWNEARFGMFIHWGIYSVPGGIWNGKEIPGIGEWIMNRAKIPVADYAKFAEQFNPVKFNADKWVSLAKAAGVKYIVITTKHHDGFAMFKSEASSYNIVDASPFKRDVIKELAEACAKHDMKLGFYYSQAQDWHQPGGAAAGGHWDKAQDGSMDEYIDKIVVPQVHEILTKYGPVAVLWWDTPVDMNKERAEKIHNLLKLQPNIITNNRLGGGFAGDLETPEQSIPATGIPGKNWESCMTMNDTWGFKKKDNNWKSTEKLIRNLIDIASKGGNYLLNVGPTPEGLIPDSSVVRLKEMGEWLKSYGASIYATTASPFPYLKWGRCTRKGNILYLHVFNWPNNGILNVPLKNQVNRAYLLLPDSKSTNLKVKSSGNHLSIQVPATAPNKIASVIALEIKGEPQIEAAPSFGLKGIASSSQTGATSDMAFDGKADTKWKAAADQHTGWLEADFGKPVKICAVAIQEGGSFERNIQKFSLEYKVGDQWKQVFEGKNIGEGFLRPFSTVKAREFRLNILEAQKSPFITEFQLYKDE